MFENKYCIFSHVVEVRFAQAIFRYFRMIFVAIFTSVKSIEKSFIQILIENSFLSDPRQRRRHFVCCWSLSKYLVAVALHSTEALMAGILKSEYGPHAHGYGGGHHPHHSHGPPMPPGMPMTSLAPFGLPHGLDVGFPHQGMWGKYWFQILVTHYFY